MNNDLNGWKNGLIASIGIESIQTTTLPLSPSHFLKSLIFLRKVHFHILITFRFYCLPVSRCLCLHVTLLFVVNNTHRRKEYLIEIGASPFSSNYCWNCFACVK